MIRYHGGKWKLAPWIISHFPDHRSYIEPFAGAASVLMLKDRSHTEVYNDRWDQVVSLFRILRDPVSAGELQRVCLLTPFSRTELEKTYEITDDPIENARRMVYRSYAGFGSASSNSDHRTGFRSNTQSSNRSAPLDWYNWPACIPAFVERLRGVCVENLPAVELIGRQQRSDTLIYGNYILESRAPS